MKRVVIGFCFVLFAGCAAIPNGGNHGDILKLGRPGDLLSSVKLGQGLLVATASLDQGREVNLQVTKEDVPQTEPLKYSRTLTIGKFSKVLGSGFAKKEDIYYRKRIWYKGKDFFEIGSDKYLVEWKCDYSDVRTYLIADIYEIEFRRFYEHASNNPVVSQSEEALPMSGDVNEKAAGGSGE